MKQYRIPVFAVLVLFFSIFLFNGIGYAQGSPSTKKVTKITARYIKKDTLNQEGAILVGTALSLTDFKVTMEFNEGEPMEIPEAEMATKCKLSHSSIPFGASVLFPVTLTYLGDDKISDKEISADVTLHTTNVRLKGIKAIWKGKTKYHIGDPILKKEISVDGIYDAYSKNGSVSTVTSVIKTELITLSPETVTINGDNYIKATYENFESIFKIRGYGVTGIKVEYSGPKTMVVGQTLDKKKIKVSRIFSSGEVQKVENFNLNETEIKVTGPNVFLITYETFTYQLTVNGVEKSPEKISVKYEGGDLVVGSPIDPTKMIVTVTNNDKTTEVISSGFTISPEKVSKVGANTITIIYKGLKETVTIKATEILPGSIVAMYNGQMIIEGSPVKKSEISVTAYFPNGTSKQVSDFTYSPETMNTVGVQEVIVSYKGAKASIFVPVTAKLVTSLSVTYKGGALVQFSSIDRKDIVVTATYNDGSSQNVSDYMMTNTVATKVGKNVFTIYYGGKQKDLIVEALARLIIGRGTLKTDITGEDYSTSLTAYIENQFVREGVSLETEEVEKANIRKAVRRVNKTSKFLAFHLSVESFQFDENKYMITEATIPEGFNPAKVGIFYTPDQSKVMVQLTGGLVSSDLYRFYVYRSGTYVIMEKEETDIGRQELREDDNHSPFLVASYPEKMKIKQKKSMKPFLLFAAFDNDGFKYESDDEDILTVSKDGLMTAKAEGTASVTVTSNVGGYAKTYEIIVTK